MRLSLLLSVLLLGCEVDTVPEALLGTGSWEWQPLEDGEGIPVILGPQGGYHVLGSVRLKGLVPGNVNDLEDPKNPTTTFSVQVDGTNLTPGSVFVQGIRPAPESVRPWTHEMLGRFAILDIESDQELNEVPIVFSVTVTDHTGLSVSDEMTLQAYPYELN